MPPPPKYPTIPAAPPVNSSPPVKPRSSLHIPPSDTTHILPSSSHDKPKSSLHIDELPDERPQQPFVTPPNNCGPGNAPRVARHPCC